MGREFRVYGIGNAVVDLQLRISEQQFQELSTEKATMRLVTAAEQDELLGKFTDVDIDWSSGGSLANSMIALAQLGAKGAYGALVGNDGFGEFFLNEMDELGVSLHNPPMEGLRTSTCAILVTPDAERTMRTFLGASSAFDERHVDEAFIAQSDWLFIEGYLLMQEGGRRAIQKACEVARRHGTRIGLTASDAFVIEQFPDPFAEVASQAELLFCNLREAQAVTGCEGVEEVFSALQARFKNFALTLNADGAWISLEGKVARVAGFDVNAIDETGAGDMFAGAFLYGMTNGYSAEKIGRIACFFASRVVSQLGARMTGDIRALAIEAGVEL